MIFKLPGKKSHSKPAPSNVLIPNADFKAIESYKAIRTNIDHLLKDASTQTILVTSPYAAAGKTTTSANLSIAFAQLGKKVLVIDCDMRKPSIHKLFSLHVSPGLSDVLTGKEDLGVIKESIYENLSILTAGTIPENPSELLHSKCFKDLLITLSDKYDTIFIDAPPVDAVTDAVIISQQVSGTVLVIRQNSTEKEALVRTVHALNTVNANILGYVLNAVDYEKFSYRYGHYTTKYSKKYSSYYYYTSDIFKSEDEEK